MIDVVTYSVPTNKSSVGTPHLESTTRAPLAWSVASGMQ
jgi:hypothetical protein